MDIKGNIIAGTIFIGMLGFNASIYYLSNKSGLENVARKYATLCIGDKQAPLNDGERNTWYQIMEIKEGEKPSERDLSKFVHNVKLFQNEKREMPYWPTN